MVESLRPLKPVSKIVTEMCCFHCKLNHRLLSCFDYVSNYERGVGLFGIFRSSAEALTARPANEVLRLCCVCCLLVACMYVCVCI